MRCERQMSKARNWQTQARRMLTTATGIVVVGIVLGACAFNGPQPVLKPCGVIKDPLGDVQATTAEGNRRIDAHFERGVRAKCWDRSSAAKGAT